MHSFYNLTFALGLALSIAACSGVGLFKALTEELASIVTFYLFFNILILISGVIGALSCFKLFSSASKLVDDLTSKLQRAFFPVACALLGIILGFTICAIYSELWQTALKGTVVFIVIWIMARMSERYLAQSLYFLKTQKFESKNELYALLVVSIYLIVIGVLGLSHMLEKTAI
ncbi:hypothetical protein [Vibrio rotiferianus]|uniref:hypothetical protein n=1 Tax=Vibrio rotiferianus TaxID=190895 RepID=UPI00390C23C2